MSFRVGDRVRIVTAENPYTGCRGTVAEPASAVPAGPDGEPLGCYVAIDGENGLARPFLAEEIERLPMARVRRSGSPALQQDLEPR